MPSGVRRTRRLVRSNSAPPTSRSSDAISLLTRGRRLDKPPGRPAEVQFVSDRQERLHLLHVHGQLRSVP